MEPEQSVDVPLVIVIDGNATVRRCVVRALEGIGLEIVQAGSPQELDAAKVAPGLVIMDFSRPLVDSQQMARQLSALVADREGSMILPLIVRPERMPILEGLSSKMMGILSKPFTPHALTAAVLTHLAGFEAKNPYPRSRPAREATEDILDVEVDIFLEDRDEDLFDDDPGESAAQAEMSTPTPTPTPAPSDPAPAPEPPPRQSAAAVDDLTMPDLDNLLEDIGSGELDNLEWDDGELEPVERFASGLPAGLDSPLSPMPSVSRPHQVEQDVNASDILWEGELPGVSRDAAPEPPPVTDTEGTRLEAPPSAPSSRPVRRQLAEWATQLAADWDRIGMEKDLLRRAELIQTAVLDIESTPGGRVPTSGQIAALARASVSAPSADEPSEKGFSGDLALLRPIEIFRVVRESRLRGALELHSPSESSYRLTLWGDTLRYLEPRVPHEDLLLGRILLARGKLEPEALEVALAQDDELPLGQRLVEVGILEEEELLEALELQARAYFYEICNFSKGAFTFREVKSRTLDSFGQSEPRPLNFKVSQLVLDVLRGGEDEEPRSSTEDAATRMVANPLRASSSSGSRPNLRVIETPPELRARNEKIVEEGGEVEEIVQRLKVLGLLDGDDEDKDPNPDGSASS